MADARKESQTQQRVPVHAANDSLAARIIEAQDNERRKISRELHDSVGQSLVAAIMSINGFKRENSIGNNSKLDEALRVLDSALSEVRTLSHLLHPPNLELLGLEPGFGRFDQNNPDGTRGGSFFAPSALDRAAEWRTKRG